MRKDWMDYISLTCRGEAISQEEWINAEVWQQAIREEVRKMDGEPRWSILVRKKTPTYAHHYGREIGFRVVIFPERERPRRHSTGLRGLYERIFR